MTAHDILTAAQRHMQDRAATYDKPEGERSMGATVEAFRAVTGDGLMNTEERGWLFMELLKAVRSQQGDYRADNYEDGAAYFALMGEAAARDRKKPITRGLPSDADQEKARAMIAAAWEEGEERMEQIGRNSGDGLHYGMEWQVNTGSIPSLPGRTKVEVEFVSGGKGIGQFEAFEWDRGQESSIARWRIAR